MNIILTPSHPHGRIKAIASKSAAHRLLICAAFARGKTTLCCEETNEDINATVNCLNSLGANIIRRGSDFTVSPIEKLNTNATLNCRESGSTLRFLLPVTCFLGANASFKMAGRLPERPLSPLREELERCGITFSPAGSDPLVCKGKVTDTQFSIPGNVSSQFISGLLFAIAISGRTGTVRIIGKLESEPYINMTLNALNAFGVKVERTSEGYSVTENNGLLSPVSAFVEGDWSNAAFPLAMGAIGNAPITVCGIFENSAQGDKRIVSLLREFGAKVCFEDNNVTVSPAELHGIEIDASQIPDLVPILATVASVANGKTVIYNAERLRIKESDRLHTVSTMLNALGADVTETEGGLIINGVSRLTGGSTSSFGDHRIAMSAAVASTVCDSDVYIENAGAASKSYPGFWKDIGSLGVKITETK